MAPGGRRARAWVEQKCDGIMKENETLINHDIQSYFALAAPDK